MQIEHREVFLKERPKSLYDISLKGTIPVLKVSDDCVIDESIDIMKWVIKDKKSNWYTFNKSKQDKMISHNDCDFKYWLDKYKYHIRNPEQNQGYYRKKCIDTLLSYESILAQKPYLMGDSIQLVDAALFPFVRQFANVERVWFSQTFPYLEEWLQNWILSSCFISVMSKFIPWKLGDEALYISYGKEECK